MLYKVTQYSVNPDVFKVESLELVKNGWRAKKVIDGLTEDKAVKIKAVLEGKADQTNASKFYPGDATLYRRSLDGLTFVPVFEPDASDIAAMSDRDFRVDL